MEQDSSQTVDRSDMFVHGLQAITIIAMLALAWWDKANSFAVPALLIVVSLGVFVSLMIYTTRRLSGFGLGDNTQPFGLPSGTLRAVLTLAFIVLVGVLASYVLVKSNSRTGVSQVLTITVPVADVDRVVQSAQGSALGKDLIVLRGLPKNDSVDLTILGRADYAAADDVAKQIINYTVDLAFRDDRLLFRGALRFDSRNCRSRAAKEGPAAAV